MITLKLRPHHLLCIHNFIGRGYSDTFTAHMSEVIDMLERDPEIELVRGCDELCSACPHNLNGVCDSSGKVDRYDRGVLKACGLTCGERENWSVLSDMVKEKVFRAEQFERICSDCQWYGCCSTLQKNRSRRPTPGHSG